MRDWAAGQICPVCKQEIRPQEDVVVCPVCGAPHHRDCYTKEGHCALESLHGTPQQYRTPGAEEAEEESQTAHRHCAHCGLPLSDTSRYCPRCGHPVSPEAAPRPTEDWTNASRGISLDPLGGVPPQEEIDGIPAEELARFINYNTPRYLPLFRQMQQGRKFSWNWAAFLFPEGWLFYRKCYKEGFLFLLISVFAWAMTMPFMVFAAGLPLTSGTTAEVYALLSEAISSGKVTLPMMGGAYGGMLLMLGYRILCGLLGDRIYKAHCLDRIQLLREQTPEYEELLPRVGSVNFLLLVVLMLVSHMIPNLLLYFIS